MASKACERFGVSRRRAARLLNLAWSTCSYQAKVKNDEQLRERMKELAAKHRRFGSPRLHVLLRNEGLVINHKRTERVYSEMRLQVKTRRRKKLGAVVRIPRPRAKEPMEVWSIDFVHDALDTGRRLRSLTIIDDFSKICPGILVETSISGLRVTRYLDELGDLPKRIRCDNGPEFTSKDFLN